MSKTFDWKYSSKGFLRGGTYCIFLDGELIGEIPDYSLEKTATINHHQFTAKTTGHWGFPQTYNIINPDNKSIYCRIEKHSDHQIYAFTSEKIKYDISISSDDNPAQTNGLVIQKYDDKMYFAESGKIEIRSDKDIELLIVCLFFVLYLRNLDHNT